MIKSWDSKFKVNSAFHHLNDRGAKAIYNFIKQSKICQNYTGILEIQELKVHTDVSNDLSPDITNIKKLLNKLYGFVILKPIDDLNIFEQPVVSWLIAQSMGETLGQNYNAEEKKKENINTEKKILL